MFATGNKSAAFPLQLLEWDVDVLNTVQLSNHTGESFSLVSLPLSGSEVLKISMQDLVRRRRYREASGAAADSSSSVGYGKWGGMRMDAAHLQDVFDAMDSNGLLRQSHLLTGERTYLEHLESNR